MQTIDKVKAHCRFVGKSIEKMKMSERTLNTLW